MSTSATGGSELPAAQRERIRLEEVFRDEVRRSLTPPTSTGKRVWKSLNSGFALWLLSTVVVGTVTWSYARLQQRHESERERARIARRLDLELADRLARLRTYLSQLEANGRVANIMDVLRAVDQPSDQPYKTGVFGEFKDSSLRALLWQLVEVDDDSEVKVAYDAAVGLQQLAATLTIQMADTEKPAILKKVRDFTDVPLNLQRWQEPVFGGSGAGSSHW